MGGRKCESAKEREREWIVGRLWTQHDRERERKSARELKRVKRKQRKRKREGENPSLFVGGHVLSWTNKRMREVKILSR